MLWPDKTGGNDCLEGVRVVDGKIGEHLAVEVHFGFFEEILELGVAKFAIIDVKRCVDALDPEPTQITFSQPAADVGVLASVEISFLGDTIEAATGHAHPAGSLEHLLVPSPPGGSGFDAHIKMTNV